MDRDNPVALEVLIRRGEDVNRSNSVAFEVLICAGEDVNSRDYNGNL